MKLLLWNTSVISIKKLTIIHEFSFFKLHLRRKTFIDMSNCNRGSRKLLVLFGQPTKANWRGMLEKRGWGGGEGGYPTQFLSMRSVPATSPNTHPIWDQIMPFSTPVFRRGSLKLCLVCEFITLTVSQLSFAFEPKSSIGEMHLIHQHKRYIKVSALWTEFHVVS